MRIPRAARTPFELHEPAIEILARWTRTTLTECAAALSFARRRGGAHDTRPELLLWFIARDDRYEHAVVEYTALRTLVWAARRTIPLEQDVLAAAVVDAMALVRTFATEVGSDERARLLGIRASTFRDIRNAAEGYLLRGLRDGYANYLRGVRDRSNFHIPLNVHNGSEVRHVRTDAQRVSSRRRALGRTGIAAAA